MAREYFADLNSEVANKLDKTGQAADSDKLDGFHASDFQLTASVGGNHYRGFTHLLFRIPNDGTDKVDGAVFNGNLYLHRGSATSGFRSTRVILSVAAGYTGYSARMIVQENDHVILLGTCTYLGNKYLALRVHWEGSSQDYQLEAGGVILGDVKFDHIVHTTGTGSQGGEATIANSEIYNSWSTITSDSFGASVVQEEGSNAYGDYRIWSDGTREAWGSSKELGSNEEAEIQLPILMPSEDGMSAIVGVGKSELFESPFNFRLSIQSRNSIKIKRLTNSQSQSTVTWHVRGR